MTDEQPFLDAMLESTPDLAFFIRSKSFLEDGDDRLHRGDFGLLPDDGYARFQQQLMMSPQVRSGHVERWLNEKE
jgi:hypothetical protein